MQVQDAAPEARAEQGDVAASPAGAGPAERERLTVAEAAAAGVEPRETPGAQAATGSAKGEGLVAAEAAGGGAQAPGGQVYSNKHKSALGKRKGSESTVERQLEAAHLNATRRRKEGLDVPPLERLCLLDFLTNKPGGPHDVTEVICHPKNPGTLEGHRPITLQSGEMYPGKGGLVGFGAGMPPLGVAMTNFARHGIVKGRPKRSKAAAAAQKSNWFVAMALMAAAIARDKELLHLFCKFVASCDNDMVLQTPGGTRPPTPEELGQDALWRMLLQYKLPAEYREVGEMTDDDWQKVHKLLWALMQPHDEAAAAAEEEDGQQQQQQQQPRPAATAQADA
ncbi:hypothetical protein ABPG75_005620 [Micractinium tetrahymenae]